MATPYDQVDADLYRRARPEYPVEAVTQFAAEVAPNGERILDIACGTGKLTAPLTALGRRVLGVDGALSMLLSNQRPSQTFCGLAERLPIAGAAFSAATVGQAFHWFSTETALPELARVLRPRGRLGLIWNFRDLASPMVQAVEEIVSPLAGNSPTWRGVKSWETVVETWGPFRLLLQRSLSWERERTAQEIIDGVLTRSYVAALPAGDQAQLSDLLKARLSGWATVAIPYVTTWYVFERH